MSDPMDSAARLFGSKVRANVLGILASSREPKTGYEVSKILDMYPSKVYQVLRDLEDTPFVKVVRAPRGKGYLLADEDLRRFLLRTVRITAEADWFADRARRMERTQEILRRMPPVELPKSSGKPGPRARATLREFVRPPEKDAILARLGLRTSVRRVKRGRRE